MTPEEKEAKAKEKLEAKAELEEQKKVLEDIKTANEESKKLIEEIKEAKAIETVSGQSEAGKEPPKPDPDAEAKERAKKLAGDFPIDL